ncbi:DEAD/DEAH box helicase [Fodinibius sediminis]|uniref:Type III restriction enzyme n=1 Tax=Fodinibius sediminis TaxID=1214077 RepID=A0A521F8L1_9BACT|nr:DEAD/DEAH box helicase family protein [Fodinibius sediminis]SMO92497.1 type III restriction enzyme [Fodinibius sediminis]
MKFTPFDILDPKVRWKPSEQITLEEEQQLLPPLVLKIRKEVQEWRESGYKGASKTTKSLFSFWFDVEHEVDGNKFQYFFSQREAIESIIYLYEIREAHDKYDLMRFDNSGMVSTGMFDETWTRYVIKAATGSGKTKVMGLAIVWSYFQNLYEEDSGLAKNFLVIAPNIIVLNRLKTDFKGLKMFRNEPFIPGNGFQDKWWENDFQPTLHIQDEIKPLSKKGNIFLSNIHRVYMTEDSEPTLEEEFLGSKPKADADTDNGIDLDEVLRSKELDNLMVLNDEAHHIHDSKLQWFQSIQDINNKMKLQYDRGLSLQVDFTATPKDQKGNIFVQTISDYPLVEAIKQNVVKTPVLPDEASRSKLEEKDSSDVVEQYRDYIDLGYQEWKQQYEDLKSQRKPILFVMANKTKEADKIAEYLESHYQEMKDKVLVIHTDRSGRIKEDVKSRQDEVEMLRKAANEVDDPNSPYRAIVSVLMLREGWDVRNVSTIVGLRPFSADSKILPEQALGRGLRKMFDLKTEEELVVVGTDPFIEFVESIKTEGVEFNYRPMSLKSPSDQKNPIIVEVDEDNPEKDLDELDIELPIMTPRIYREYKNLELIDLDQFSFDPIYYKEFSEEEKREIVFRDLDGNVSHATEFSGSLPNYRNMVSFFTQSILKDNRLVSGFNVLYPKVECFIREDLFGREVVLEEANTLRNMSRPEVPQTIKSTFKKAIDELTVEDKGTADIQRHIKLRDVKPKVFSNRKFVKPSKSVFNKVVSEHDNEFELSFSSFLDKLSGVKSFAKNTTAVNFTMEYQKEDKNISNYQPDFFIKAEDEESVYIVETKGREDLDAFNKFNRLERWCKDVNEAGAKYTYKPIYIQQNEWEEYKKKIKHLDDIVNLFPQSIEK